MPVSIIVPTLNEERCLGATLRHLRRQRPHEIIVVDGGSQDATCRIAASADRLLHGPTGRGGQMNLGAAQASGDVLLFLHADCTLEAGAVEEAERRLQAEHVAAGCFTMTIPAAGPLFRSIAACASARVRLTGSIYGDQGLFLRREVFERLGGFPEIGLMEDVFFSRKLRRLGRVIVASRRIFVSPRRWQQQGILRQTFRNWTLTLLAAGGIHPNRLALHYPVMR